MKALFLSAALLAACATQAQSWHVASTFHIKSDGKWDYIALNPVTQQLYASHGTQVNILDKNSGDSVGVIPNTTGVHGIGFAPAFHKGYTTNGKLNTATVFDIHSNKVLGEVKTGENPDAILYDAFSKKIIVCNGKSKDLSVIDPATDQVVHTIPVGGRPETAVSDDAGKIYVNLEDKSEIVVVDATTFTAGAHWPLGKGEAPTGLAIDTKTKRLFAGCDNKLLVVMNATNGKVVTTLPIGDGCDGVAFDEAEHNIFAANGEGTLTVIKEQSADKYSAPVNVPTKKGARTLVVDPATHAVYLPTADLLAAAAGAKPQAAPGSFQVLKVTK
ncbi:YncE family protein [Chitinophaga vietnamensis]|uniref:YncE family protein n=1 Tax=Chitinophaga vietnamensis TaxID=2593957 RepID=UPI00117777C3|nr:YncE family protein [Chitinophaga vietnamensis]